MQRQHTIGKHALHCWPRLSGDLVLGELVCDMVGSQLHFWEDDSPVETRGKGLRPLKKHLLRVGAQEINGSWVKVVPHRDRRVRHPLYKRVLAARGIEVPASAHQFLAIRLWATGPL